MCLCIFLEWSFPLHTWACIPTNKQAEVISIHSVIYLKEPGSWAGCALESILLFAVSHPEPSSKRCPAWAGLFSITHYNAMTSLCKTVPTPCSSHLQEAEFLKETYQEFCGFRHKVGVDLTHAVSLLLSLMDSSHLQGFYKHIYIHFDYK